MQQAAEVIELFFNIWNQDVNYEETDALVHAILSDQPEEKERIAMRMHIDIASIHTIWMLRIIDGNGLTLDANQRLHSARRLKLFMQEHHKLVIVDSYDQYLIAFADNMLFEEAPFDLAQTFAELLKGDGLTAEIVISQGVENTAQARSAYMLMDANLTAARTVYSAKRIYAQGEIRFIQTCRDILSQGEAAVAQKLSCLDKLRTLCDGEELLQTLCAFLLDGDANTQQTGALLHLHKNTVKYRLNKVRATLNCDLTQMSEAFEFYQAAALCRLLRCADSK